MLPMAFSFILQPLQTVSSLMAINSVNIRSSPEHKKKNKKETLSGHNVAVPQRIGGVGQ